MVSVDDVPCHLVEVGTRTGPSMPGEPVYEIAWMTQADLEAAQKAERERAEEDRRMAIDDERLERDYAERHAIAERFGTGAA